MSKVNRIIEEKYPAWLVLGYKDFESFDVVVKECSKEISDLKLELTTDAHVIDAISKLNFPVEILLWVVFKRCMHDVE